MREPESWLVLSLLCEDTSGRWDFAAGTKPSGETPDMLGGMNPWRRSSMLLVVEPKLRQYLKAVYISIRALKMHFSVQLGINV